MEIIGIKAKDILACAGAWAQVVEAEVVEEDGSITYVLAQEFDTTELTVSKKSLYGFLAEDGAEPVVEFLEEYTAWKDAKGSAYAAVFAQLRKVMKMLGRCE